ncbi:hypothetical protein DSUL_50082 [Desulfovibrionales bacterium]
MIEAAEAVDNITQEKIVLEIILDNISIDLTMIYAVKGYPVKLLMPDIAS